MVSSSSSPNFRETCRVHVDTEFSSLAHVNPALISIGLASDDGSEFYGEDANFPDHLASDFVRANIYPLLTPTRSRMKRSELSARLWSWLDELPCKNVLITVDYPTDWRLLDELLDQPHPKIVGCDHLWTIIKRFARANTYELGQGGYEFAQYYNALTAAFVRGFQDYFVETGEIPHHALSDAKGNRKGYGRLVTDFGMPS